MNTRTEPTPITISESGHLRFAGGQVGVTSNVAIAAQTQTRTTGLVVPHPAPTPRQPTEAEKAALLSGVRGQAEQLRELVNELRNSDHLVLDQRWISLGVTDLQRGLMALERGITQPTTF